MPIPTHHPLFMNFLYLNILNYASFASITIKKDVWGLTPFNVMGYLGGKYQKWALKVILTLQIMHIHTLRNICMTCCQKFCLVVSPHIFVHNYGILGGGKPKWAKIRIKLDLTLKIIQIHSLTMIFMFDGLPTHFCA